MFRKEILSTRETSKRGGLYGQAAEKWAEAALWKICEILILLSAEDVWIRIEMIDKKELSQIFETTPFSWLNENPS